MQLQRSIFVASLVMGSITGMVQAQGREFPSASLVPCQFDQIGVGSICPHDWQCIDSILPGNPSICVPPDETALAPVCGIDGQSYRNSAVADAVGVAVSAPGTCRHSDAIEPKLPTSVAAACAEGQGGALITLDVSDANETDNRFTVLVTDRAFIEGARFYRERMTQEPELIGHTDLQACFSPVTNSPGCDTQHAWNVDGVHSSWDLVYIDPFVRGPRAMDTYVQDVLANGAPYCPNNVKVVSIIERL